jgi:AcrR family transcriptional regulator
MRDVADAAGVREAAIYRHFRGKDEMAREIFTSWYGWYTRQVREVAEEEGPMRKKLRALVHVEFETARTHPQEFLYFCDNEARFLRGLSHDIPRVRLELVKLVRTGQATGDVRSGDPGVPADMLSGALCGAAISAISRKDLQILESEELAVESCWQMLRRNK